MSLHPIHLNDTPATTPEHRAHIKRIAEAYKARTEARRRVQEMQEEWEMQELEWDEEEE